MWLSFQLWSEPPVLIGRPHSMDFRRLAPPQDFIQSKRRLLVHQLQPEVSPTPHCESAHPGHMCPQPHVVHINAPPWADDPGHSFGAMVWPMCPICPMGLCTIVFPCVSWAPWTLCAPCVLCALGGCIAPSPSHLPDGQIAGKGMVRDQDLLRCPDATSRAPGP